MASAINPISFSLLILVFFSWTSESKSRDPTPAAWPHQFHSVGPQLQHNPEPAGEADFRPGVGQWHLIHLHSGFQPGVQGYAFPCGNSLPQLAPRPNLPRPVPR
jgi:hypothetical protein